MLLSFLISVPLVVGIMGLALKTLRGEQMQVSDFFDGFRFPQIKNGYVAVAGPSLLWAVLNAVVMPASLTAGLGQTSTAAPAGLYGRLGLIALIWLFAYPFVALLYPAVAQGFSGMDALKLSLQRGRDNWVQLFLVILLTALIGTIAAAVTCGLGLVLALPWCFCVLGRTYLVLMEGGAPVATVIRRLGPSTATQRPAPPPSSAEASGQTRRYAAVAAVCVLVISGAFGVSRVAPAIGKRMAVAAANSCQTNLRQAGLAMLMYVQDYDGHMPHGAEWCDAIQPYVKNLQICTCPALRGRKGGYALNDSLVGQRVTGAQNPAQTIMLFDASSGWNADGGSGLMAFRHLGASNVCYAEGHVSAAFAGNPYVARGFDTANAPGGPGFTSTLPPSGAPGPGKPGAPEPPGPPPGAPPTGAPPGAAPAPQEAQAPEGVRVFDVQTGIGLTPDCRRPLRATSRFPASTHEVDVTYAETAPPNCFWTVAVRLYRNGRHLPSFDDASAPSADGRGHEEFVWNGGAPPGRYSIRFLWNGAQVGEGQFTVGS
jgi:uncharacterized protein YjeT (DUF2065 family)